MWNSQWIFSSSVAVYLLLLPNRHILNGKDTHTYDPASAARHRRRQEKINLREQNGKLIDTHRLARAPNIFLVFHRIPFVQRFIICIYILYSWPNRRVNIKILYIKQLPYKIRFFHRAVRFHILDKLFSNNMRGRRQREKIIRSQLNGENNVEGRFIYIYTIIYREWIRI